MTSEVIFSNATQSGTKHLIDTQLDSLEFTTTQPLLCTIPHQQPSKESSSITRHTSANLLAWCHITLIATLSITQPRSLLDIDSHHQQPSKESSSITRHTSTSSSTSCLISSMLPFSLHSLLDTILHQQPSKELSSIKKHTFTSKLFYLGPPHIFDGTILPYNHS